MVEDPRVDGVPEGVHGDLPQPAPQPVSGSVENEIEMWLLSKGYVYEKDYPDLLGIAWSHRSGYDFADLQFYRLKRREGDQGWDAIIGCHASGTNPRVQLGCCETLEEVQATHELVRRLNGYPGPEDDSWRKPTSAWKAPEQMPREDEQPAQADPFEPPELP